MFVPGLCNLILGPIIIISGFLLEFGGYQAKPKADKDNTDIVELELKYWPCLCVHVLFTICCLTSGLCATLASKTDNRTWAIGLANVADLFSKASMLLIGGMLMYNFDPKESKVRGWPQWKWESIKLPIPTGVYCFFVQIYFSMRCIKLIDKKQNEVQNEVQDEVQDEIQDELQNEVQEEVQPGPSGASQKGGEQKGQKSGKQKGKKKGKGKGQKGRRH
ncbi:uncharacterized protein LOC110850006 [Folsomia candida]|uniref:uncharacterized protein LOC110850006 n=1 Tax=Folsomia candida TaxID=158441 RepID=UPI000B903835|nr:uncharacterized protein LOC110850006 [Folsomia candida]